MENRILIVCLVVLAVCKGEVEECNQHAMQAIVERAAGAESDCRPRPTIVSLPEPGDEFLYVTPKIAEVLRCGGGCGQNHLKCLPHKVTIKKVQVFLAFRSLSAGQSSSSCGTVEVEEHLSCQCGCNVTPSHCSQWQEFLPSECACSCPNYRERELCVAKNWHWNSDLCKCMCPNPPYPTCPTSYIFDHTATCSCQPVAYDAFTVYELVIVISVVGSLALTFSLIQCYRHKIGLFRKRRQLRPRTESFWKEIRGGLAAARTASSASSSASAAERAKKKADKRREQQGPSIAREGPEVEMKLLGASATSNGNREPNGVELFSQAEVTSSPGGHLDSDSQALLAENSEKKRLHDDLDKERNSNSGGKSNLKKESNGGLPKKATVHAQIEVEAPPKHVQDQAQAYQDQSKVSQDKLKAGQEPSSHQELSSKQNAS